MILRALCTRPIRARPARFLATVAGVSIGVASIVSTLLASRAAVASLGADIEEIAGVATLEVRRPGGVDVGALVALRDLCGEVEVAPIVEDTVNVPALGDFVRVLGVDTLLDGQRMTGLDLDTPDAEPGTRPDSFDSMVLGRGVAVSERLADELGLAVGAPLEVVAGAQRTELEVAAVFRPRRLATAWDRVVVCDVALAQELFGRDHLDRIALHPRAELEIDLDGLAARVAERLPPGYRVEPASARREEGERMVRALDFNLTALSGVSLLVGVVLVATTLATSVVQRRHAIALLRSLGASRRQLATAVVVEAGTIGALGGALGVALGWVGARAALASVHTTVATVVPDAIAGAVRLEPRWILLGLGCGIASALVAALLPLREAVRVPPLQGLRSENPESVTERSFRGRALAFAALAVAAFVCAQLPAVGDRPIGALAAALLILATLLVLSAPLVDLCAALRLGRSRGRLGIALRVAQAALESGRRRAAWAAGAVGVAVGLAVSMATMVGSFRETVVAWTEQTMRSDLFVRPMLTANGVSIGRIDSEVVRVASELFGAEAVDPFRSSAAYVDDQKVELAGAELRVVAREGGVPFLDGRTSQEVFAEAVRVSGAVVNEPFARRFGRGRGDVVTLTTGAGVVEREIVGVYRDYSGHTGRVVLDRADFLALYPDEGVRNIAIYLPPDRSAPEARRALTAALGGRFEVDVLLNAEVRRGVLEVFERTFAVTIALQLIAAVVAAIAVVTVLGAIVEERRGELSVLRVLGASRWQVAGVVVGEALLLGLAGTLGGVLVGLVVGYVLVAIVNVQSFGWSLDFRTPWRSLATTFALVVPACIAAGLVPAWLALRRAPREDLRELA